MKNIPEDSVLRRHYLTELRNSNKQFVEEVISLSDGRCSIQAEHLVEEAPSKIPFSHWVTASIVLLILFTVIL